jgi:adenylate cyclase
VARTGKRRVRPRTARLLRVGAVVMIISGFVGAVFASVNEPSPAGYALGILMGAISGAVLTAFETRLGTSRDAKLRPLPMIVVLALRSIVYAVVFVLARGVAIGVVALATAQAPHSALPMMSASYLAISFGVALAINFVLVLRLVLGPRMLLALVTGRYQQPREEERVVMFLDLHGSTNLAERLGDRQFHRFLNRIFFDITDPVLESGGEIYRYIGDEIIITWPRGSDRDAVVCLFAIDDALVRRRESYVRTFGAAPQLRGALHRGPLVVGEMGDVKREIVMIGDTMNTAARIEETCRTTQRDYIASAAVVKAAAQLPEGVCAESLGAIELRGKEGAIKLFALARLRSPGAPVRE